MQKPYKTRCQASALHYVYYTVLIQVCNDLLRFMPCLNIVTVRASYTKYSKLNSSVKINSKTQMKRRQNDIVMGIYFIIIVVIKDYGSAFDSVTLIYLR